MENTINNKRKFFYHYYGVECLISPYSQKIDIVGFTVGMGYEDNYCLGLRDVKDITSTEIYEYYDLEFERMKCDAYTYSFVEELLKDECFIDSTKIDFLRSKGFLVNYMDLTPEQIIEYGWAKIITK